MRMQFKKLDNIKIHNGQYVIIRYRSKDNSKSKTNLPFEVGSACYVNGEFHVSGYDQKVFNSYYEITGWSHYPYTFQNNENSN